MELLERAESMTTTSHMEKHHHPSAHFTLRRSIRGDDMTLSPPIIYTRVQSSIIRASPTLLVLLYGFQYVFGRDRDIIIMRFFGSRNTLFSLLGLLRNKINRFLDSKNIFYW